MATGKTIMDYIDNGIQKSNDRTWNSYGIGINLNGELKFGQEIDGWKDFLTAYPPLIINGIYNTMNIGNELNYKTRRSIIGYNDKNVYLIVIDNPGANLKEAGQIALDVGCQYAVNLDGGGSTRLLYKDKVIAAAAYNRPVDNVIAIYLKKEKILYRVQLGAFSSETNATAYCKQIQQLGGTYASAYVRYIKPYYKVQVGAFSIKENAEKMVKDLKTKGYNAFITV